MIFINFIPRRIDYALVLHKKGSCEAYVVAVPFRKDRPQSGRGWSGVFRTYVYTQAIRLNRQVTFPTPREHVSLIVWENLISLSSIIKLYIHRQRQ